MKTSTFFHHCYTGICYPSHMSLRGLAGLGPLETLKEVLSQSRGLSGFIFFNFVNCSLPVTIKSCFMQIFCSEKVPFKLLCIWLSNFLSLSPLQASVSVLFFPIGR